MGKGLAATDDIFSLGVLYYTALVGKGPFEDAHPLIVSSHILTKEPLSLIELGFDKKIWRIIAHTLEKDADDRFQSARDLEFALSDFE